MRESNYVFFLTSIARLNICQINAFKPPVAVAVAFPRTIYLVLLVYLSKCLLAYLL